MQYSDVLEKAKSLKLKCKVCPVCNGVACKGEIPGVGGIGNGKSFITNVEALDKIKINMNVLGTNDPIDTSTELFGETMSLPLFVAPIANMLGNYGADMSDGDYNHYVIEACLKQNIVAFTGDGVDMNTLFKEGALEINKKGKGMITMKPWIQEGIDMRLELLKDISYTALAMDVDSAGLPLLRGAKIPAENKDVNKLKKIKEAIGNKPFIIKGIMNKEAALMALEAGADGIVVSNHGGRVLDETLGTIEVLPEIVNVVKGKMTILIDGGFRTGNDIFKALALGADGVLIGRPCALSVAAYKEEGLSLYVQKLQNELKQAMLMSGCKKISDISADKVIFR